MSKNHTMIVGETGSDKTVFQSQHFKFTATSSLDDILTLKIPSLAQVVLQQCATKILPGETSEHYLPTTKKENDQ